jgi:hypothetical protein
MFKLHSPIHPTKLQRPRARVYYLLQIGELSCMEFALRTKVSQVDGVWEFV